MSVRHAVPTLIAGLCAGLFLITGASAAEPASGASPKALEPPASGDALVLAPHRVLGMMELVADWQLSHPTGYPKDDWTEGVGAAGFMALTGVSGNDKYREAMRAVGEKLRWRLGPSKFHADDHAVGQMFAELYLQLRDPRMIAPMRAQFDEMLAEPRPGSLKWSAPDVLHRWSWCDSLFMSPGTWARLTAATGDPRYLESAIKNWWITSDYLYDKEENLYFRDSRYFEQREANGKKVFWGRGNGWVLGGLVRMLQYIPDNHPQRERFVQQYREMSERLRGLQQADGMWRASLLDPDSYRSRESSGTALYTYALAWGVNQGILPREQYGSAVKRAWKALAANLRADGKLVHVQPIGADPKHFDPDASDVFAVGAFLMAGSEMVRMGLEDAGVPRVVTVHNDSSLRRQEESVDVPGVGDGTAVMEALTTRLLPTQALEKSLLFQADLAPGETRRFLLFPRQRVPAQPPVVARAHARFVPERLDDFAWENDRVAYRTYGPAVLKDPRERLRSSGVDIWSKSAHRLVQDAWYRSGDYHNNHGEGLDFYHVGRTRGCGGLGIQDGRQLHTSSNFSQWKVLADGPLRAVFELHYDDWDVGGRKVAETRRISLDAGSHFSRVESSFVSPSAAPLSVGVGIVQRAGQGRYHQGTGSISYWEPEQGEHGSNVCAVIVPGASAYLDLPAATPSPQEAGHYVALAKVRPQQAFVYYVGSAWSKGGDFANAEDWEAHVAHTAARVAAPIKVSLSR